MINVCLLSRTTALFIIPKPNGNDERKILYDQTWKIERHFYYEKENDIQLRLFQISKDAKPEEFNKQDRQYIRSIMEQYKDDNFWNQNKLFILTGNPPEGKTILPGLNDIKTNDI